jgi:transcriptional antiterminator NusG
MADKNLEPRSGGVRVKAGVLPGVREIRRPDFTKKAADIEKAEAERVLKQGEDTDAADAAAVKASLEAQEAGGEDAQLDESAITDEPLWYVAHTYSGYENKVKINIEKTIENRHLENQIFEVRVPMQEIVEVKGGARKNVAKKMFPGYVLVNMIMSDDTWYVVRNTRGVTVFVGPGSKPVPLTEAEMKPLGIHSNNITVDFEVGDSVTVVAGIWKDTVGQVQKIDFNKQTTTIKVEMFGSEIPVEISFAEVRKMN